MQGRHGAIGTLRGRVGALREAARHLRRWLSRGLGHDRILQSTHVKNWG